MEQLHLPHHHGAEAQIPALCRELEKTEKFQTIADVFRQLGDPTRVRIFWLLCHCEPCVVNISAMMDMSSPAISHHLRALKASGLIVSRREGKEVYYRATLTQQAQLLHHMIEDLVEIACPAQGIGDFQGCHVHPFHVCWHGGDEFHHLRHSGISVSDPHNGYDHRICCAFRYPCRLWNEGAERYGHFF